MNFNYMGQRELLNVATALERKLIDAYIELGMTNSDAQGAVEAVVIKAS